MSLKGSQRGGAMQLARHLQNLSDNDHVEIYALRGFVSGTLDGALKEVQAISRGTRCEQFLFSLSLSPPETESVPVSVFEEAIERIETKLGLSGQPRAIVFHEKQGRRHAHCVWSRIDAGRMRAINLSHYKSKLQDIARDIYREQGWDMPEGFVNKGRRDELTYTQAEHQQAKRAKDDPKALKRLLRQCWERSDSKAAFAAALQQHGLILARGDRRGFVAVDKAGEVYAISRWVGVKARDVRDRLGQPDDLPSLQDALSQFQRGDLEGELEAREDANEEFTRKLAAFETRRHALVAQQRREREALYQSQETRLNALVKECHARLPNGLKKSWAHLTGSYQKQLGQNRARIQRQKEEDQAAREHLIRQQLNARRHLQRQKEQLLSQQLLQRDIQRREIGEALSSCSTFLIDPKQPLLLPVEDERGNKARVRRHPDTILEIISEKKERFTARDIGRALSRYLDDPVEYARGLDAVLASPSLIPVGEDKNGKTIYSTQAFLEIKASLHEDVQALARHGGYHVSSIQTNAAITRQNDKLRGAVGASLSTEQVAAIEHVLGPHQISAVVGLAGAGKSTMLEAAREAWERQGYQVIGAALAGKAADGLKQASGINSRTLASLEKSIESGSALPHGKTVLVIDEAGMIGTRQFARLVAHAKAAGTKLVFVGDPEQLQPIHAGRPFKALTEQLPTVKLTEIRRQKEAWQRQASRALAGGQTDDALAAYEKFGCVENCSDIADAIETLVRDYVADHNEQGDTKSRIALAHRRVDVHAINQGIRSLRKAQGELEEEILIKTDHGPRAFAARDRIVLTRNDYDLDVRNGMLGEVLEVGEIGIRVKIDGDAPRIVDLPSGYRSLDHGYATTIHKSQGATVDHCFVLKSKSMDRHLSYVALTRQKERLKIYALKNDPRTREYTREKERQHNVRRLYF